MVKAAYEHVGPVYMRFGRAAVPVINDNPEYKFELGKGIVLKEGKAVEFPERFKSRWEELKTITLMNLCQNERKRRA